MVEVTDGHVFRMIVREEFGKGNDFCQKITYRTTGAKPEDLITQFRNSFNPRIVVTVDMIATGTDIKPRPWPCTVDHRGALLGIAGSC